METTKRLKKVTMTAKQTYVLAKWVEKEWGTRLHEFEPAAVLTLAQNEVEATTTMSNLETAMRAVGVAWPKRRSSGAKKGSDRVRVVGQALEALYHSLGRAIPPELIALNRGYTLETYKSTPRPVSTPTHAIVNLIED